MKDFSTHLVEKLFTPQQITELDSIQSECIKDWLERTESDPFADDETRKELAEKIETFMNEDEVSCSAEELKMIANHVYCHLL